MGNKGSVSECWKCNYSKVIDDGYEYSFKCTKTSKRGRTIDWHMHTLKRVHGQFIPTPEEEIMQYLSRDRSIPKWCPKKGENNG